MRKKILLEQVPGSFCVPSIPEGVTPKDLAQQHGLSIAFLDDELTDLQERPEPVRLPVRGIDRYCFRHGTRSAAHREIVSALGGHKTVALTLSQYFLCFKKRPPLLHQVTVGYVSVNGILRPCQGVRLGFDLGWRFALFAMHDIFGPSAHSLFFGPVPS